MRGAHIANKNMTAIDSELARASSHPRAVSRVSAAAVAAAEEVVRLVASSRKRQRMVETQRVTHETVEKSATHRKW